MSDYVKVNSIYTKRTLNKEISQKEILKLIDKWLNDLVTSNVEYVTENSIRIRLGGMFLPINSFFKTYEIFFYPKGITVIYKDAGEEEHKYNISKVSSIYQSKEFKKFESLILYKKTEHEDLYGQENSLVSYGL